MTKTYSRKQFFMTLVLALFAVSWVGSASADKGLFLSAAGNYAQIDDDYKIDFDDIEDADDLKAVFDDSDIGFNVGAGWRFTNWLSVDAGYWDFGEFKSDSFGDSRRDSIETTAITVGGMVSVPLWIIDVYARGGAAFWDADAKYFDDDGTDPYYGVGGALNVFGSIDIYLEYVRFALENDIDTASLGIRFTF